MPQRSDSSPLIITITYVVVSGLWILFADQAIATLAQSPEELTRLHSIKSWLFVLTTAALFYFALQRWIHQSRLQIMEQIAYQSTLLEHINDAVIAADTEFNILSWNPGAATLYGWQAEEVVGKSATEILRSQPPGLWDDMLRSLQATGSWQGEAIQMRNDQTPLDVMSVVSKLYDAPGNHIGFVAVNRDITDRKRIENTMRQHTRELAALLNVNTLLLGDFSLNTRLRIIGTATRDLFPEATAVSIWLHEAASHRLHCYASTGDIIPAGTEIQVDTEQGLIGTTFRSGRASTANFAPGKKSVIYKGMRSALVMPMHLKNEAIGVLLLSNSKQADAFVQSDNTLLRTLATDAAMAIQNARLIAQLGTELAERQHMETALRDLASRLTQAQEEERRRIAMELHDEVGQTLTVARLRMSMMRSGKATDAATVSKHLQVLSDLLEDSLQTVRSISHELRPPLLDELGWNPALAWLCQRLAERSKVKIYYQVEGEAQRYPAHIELAAYRITHEALTNALRHAGTKSVRVTSIPTAESLSIRIADRGAGFDLTAVQREQGSGKGLGLLSMQERALAAHGNLMIDSRPGKGTAVEIRLPAKESQEYGNYRFAG